MKNSSYICGDSAKVKTILDRYGNCIFVHTGRRKYGLPIPDGFCTARLEIDFAELGDSAALFLYKYYNFSFMAKSMKNCTMGNNSTHFATSAHETSESLYSKFQVEKYGKNKAYAFILSSGLLSEFAAFSDAYDGIGDTAEGRLSLILENL